MLLSACPIADWCFTGADIIAGVKHWHPPALFYNKIITNNNKIICQLGNNIAKGNYSHGRQDGIFGVMVLISRISYGEIYLLRHKAE